MRAAPWRRLPAYLLPALALLALAAALLWLSPIDPILAQGETDTPTNTAPQFAGATAIRYIPENSPAGANIGARLTATDAEGDDLTYALTGPEAGLFDIDPLWGQIKVKTPLDYETQASYLGVTVTVHDGKDAEGGADASVDDSIDVEIAVINVDEAGTVALDPEAPRTGAAVVASLSDPDGGVTGVVWVWESSADGSAWDVIADATDAAYVPVDDDDGRYLRAGASYADGEGPGKRARSASVGPVTGANRQREATAPTIVSGPNLNHPATTGDFAYTYLYGDEIVARFTFSEAVAVSGNPRVGVSIGVDSMQPDIRWAQYAGSSSDGATLSFIYTVAQGDWDPDGLSVAANALELNEGSITGAGNGGLAADLSHPGVSPGDTHRVNGSVSKRDDPAPTPTPTPTPTPEPPVEDNNAPQFAAATATRSVAENSPAGTSVGDPVTATDADGDTLTYDLAGSNAFVVNNSGRIAVASGADLDYETQASHTVTVSVHDGKNTAGEADTSVDDSIAVTIAVVNVDEAGAVSLGSQTPQVGRSLTAMVRDPDGGVSGVAWTWERSANGNAWTAIAGATGAAYTPVDADVGQYLRASASYADGEGAGKSARSDATGPVTGVSRQLSANNAPQFAADTATRSVDENSAAGQNVGAPVTATDSDGDTLSYALSGSDAFTIDASGRIAVASGVDLDYETTASYAVTVTVHDGKNAGGEADTSVDDSIAVTIFVVNVDEPGVVSLSSDTPRVGRSLTATVTDPDGGVSGLAWTWQRSADGTNWAAIAGAAGAAYAPVDGDVGNYLRATASYADAQGTGKSASAQTANPAPAVILAQQAAGTSITAGPILNSPASGGVYGKGEQIIVQLTFSAPVTVSGQPRLWVSIGSAARWATYSRSSQNGATLSFAYTVQNDDRDDDGLGIMANSLELNGGSINGANGIAANLAHRGVANLSTHRVNGAGRPAAQPQTASTAPTAQFVPADWACMPAGVKPGDSFRLLFLTSTKTQATSTDIATYNSFVQARAATNSCFPTAFSSQFRAFISTSSVHAKDNTATTGEGVPIYWMKGAKVADDYADFFDDTWDSHAATNESGSGYTGGSFLAWTGTWPSGETRAQHVAGMDNVQYGDPPVSAGGILGVGNASKTNSNRLLAFSPVITVLSNTVPADWAYIPTGLGPGDKFRLLFVDDSNYRDAQSTNIGDYNGIIQGAAYTNTVLRPYNSFRMVGSTQAVDARDNTETRYTGDTTTTEADDADLGVPIYWVNGAKAADHYKDFWDGDWGSQAARTQSGNLLTTAADRRMWTGSESNGVEDAGNWLGADSPIAGKMVSGSEVKDQAYAKTETTNRHFYGLSSVITVAETPAPTPATVPANWSLIPTGVNPGDSFRLLFVTSTKREATATDIADYNTFVQTAANNNANLRPFKDQFRALVSTRTVDARDNTATTGTGVPIYWVGGNKAADDYAGFYDGGWDETYGKIESGADNFLKQVLTGSNDNGTKHATAYAGASNVRSGYLNSRTTNRQTASPLSLTTDPAQGSSLPMYALSPVFTVARTVPADWSLIPTGIEPGDSFRLLFVDSANKDAQSADITGYNSYIQVRANTNTVLRPYKDGFRMVGSTQAVDARDNTETRYTGDTTATEADDAYLDVPIYWVGGAKVADHYKDFWDGSWDSQAAKTQAGSDLPNIATQRMWTGSESNGVADTDNALGADNVTAGKMESGKEVKDQAYANNAKAGTANRHYYGLSSVLTVPEPTVPANWIYAPEDAAEGDSFRLIFVTSTTRDATSSDIADYNTFVQTAANRNSLLQPWKSYFRALISTGAVDARDNTETAPAGSSYTTGEGEPIYWVGGAKVAAHYADFYDGSWDSYAARNEVGGPLGTGPRDRQPWTGSKEDGTKDNAEYAGQSGSDVIAADLSSNNPLARWSAIKTASRSLYGLSPVIQVGAASAATPGKPAGLAAAGGEQQVALSWTNPSDTTITRYQYRQKAGAGRYGAWTDIPNSDAATISYTVTGLETGTAYTFQIRAVNDQGVGGTASDERSATTVPAQPANLKATVAGNRITLSWDNPSDSSIIRYQYQRKAGTGNYGAWTDNQNSGADTVSYTVTDLMLATLYTFKIRAVNAGGVGQESDEVSATTSSVPALDLEAAPAGDGRVVLWWDDHSSDNTITGWRYRYRLKGSASWGQWTDMPDAPMTSQGYPDPDSDDRYSYINHDTGETQSRFTVRGLQNWKAYVFEVHPVAQPAYPILTPPVNSVIGVAVGAFTPGEQPAVAPGQQTVARNFAHLPSGLKAGDRFRLIFVTNATTAATSADISHYNGVAQTAAASISGLANIDNRGFSGSFRALVSTPSVHAIDNTHTAAPGEPHYPSVPIYWLGGARVADNYAGIYGGGSWDSHAGKTESGASYTGQVWTDSDADGYHLALSSGEAAAGSLAAGQNPINNAAAANTGLKPIYAISPVLLVYPGPVQPEGFKAAPGNRSAALHWTVPRRDETVARWQYRQKASTGNYGNWTNIPGSNLDTLTYTVRGLANGTAYTFRIRAMDKRGVAGEPSAERTVIPQPPPSAGGAQMVPADWKHIPRFGPHPLVTAGESFRLIFVTKDRITAESGDIAHYNRLAAAEADHVAEFRPFKDRFRALISTATVSARDNTATTGRGAPIYWISGEQVAENYADFYDGTWEGPSHVYRARDGGRGFGYGGFRVFFGGVWTGSEADGRKSSNHFVGSPNKIMWGSVPQVNNRIAALRTGVATQYKYMYVLSPLLTVAR